MQDSVYNSVFAALSQQYRMNVVANDLANVNTAGYKKDKNLTFEDVLTRYAHADIDPNMGLKGGVKWPESDYLTQPRIYGGGHLDFSQGSLHKTGNPLNLALQGEGLFKIRTPRGDFYTRNGNFQLSREGMLVDSMGNPLLGANGPIFVPSEGQLQIGRSGSVSVDGNVLDQLDIVTVSDLNALERHGHNLLKIKEGSEARELPAREVSVAQGYLESSNVNVVKEMVKMIEILRNYEACQKVISKSNDTDSQLIRKLGKPV